MTCASVEPGAINAVRWRFIFWVVLGYAFPFNDGELNLHSKIKQIVLIF